ncbi:hypothetical protein ACIBCR_16475 [Micromonospora echinospora]|uniref:hypothetical protein n=1 Tax=Micromonospora echinospora TaxID=1877 RepID=UPI0037B8B5CD
MDHVTLTIDGQVDARPGEMRWMPPEKAATVRAAEQAETAAARLDRRANDRGIPLSRRPR